jgi:murein L,D-transpeptidase YcbB/YkuD
MRRGSAAPEIKARDDQLLLLVLRVIADLSLCTKPSLFAHISGDSTVAESTTQKLIDNALQRLEVLEFIQDSQHQLSITDLGKQFLGELTPDVPRFPRYNFSSFRTLVASSTVACWQRISRIWQDCLIRSYSLRRHIRTYVWGRGRTASRLWKAKVAPVIRGRGQAAKSCCTRGETLAASFGRWQIWFRTSLREPAVSSDPLSKVKPVFLGHLKIVGSVSLALAVLSLGVIAFLSGEQGKEKEEAATASTVRSEPRSTISIASEPNSVLASRLEAVRNATLERVFVLPVADDLPKRQHDALKAYYSTSINSLLWIDAEGPTKRAKSVIDEIARADDYGLRAADYDLPELNSEFSPGRASIDRLADIEIGLSLAVLQYVREARGGRIKPSQLTPNLDPSLDLPDPTKVLHVISRESDPAAYVRDFQPRHPQFEALRKKLLELRGDDSAEKEESKTLIASGPPLKLGVKHEQVALLRKRLRLPAGQDETLFDETVAEAVRQFQLDHNTIVDGVVGPGTRQLLNAPHLRHGGRDTQIKRILLNMERWRWLPQNLGAFYVAVNIPEFTLRVVENSKTIHTARVVVGKPNNQTPIFSNAMQTVVFGPYWNVPNSIKVEELRPYLRQEVWFFGGGGWDTSVLRRHNLRVKYRGREVDPGTIDWNRVDIRSVHIYQPPGPTNVLGKVKFLFPNKHDVYMHDTTQKELFAKDVRAESHGCMRVQNPGMLASIILQYDQGWSRARTMTAMENGYDQRVSLEQAIPVHITYFTAWINDDGSVSTFRDVYGHDARMAAALFGDSRSFERPIQISESQQHEARPSNRVILDDASPADIVDDIIRFLEN